MKTNPDLQVRENCNGEPLALLQLELAIREMGGFACGGHLPRHRPACGSQGRRVRQGDERRDRNIVAQNT